MNALAPVTQAAPQLPVSAEESAFALAQRKAKAFCSSSLVPQQYRGTENLPNVLIALEIAQRIGASPLLVMQNLYIVQGKPSWSASFLIATVNASGRFTPIRFETDGGDDPSAKSYRVRAVAKDKDTGEVCNGPWITWKMVDAEGWSKKSGSKWMTIPALMFMYRAAGFWSRVYAPEMSMGILTREEAEDVWGAAPAPAARTDHGNLRQLAARLQGEPIEAEAAASEPEPADADVPEFTAATIRAQLEAAESVDELNDAFDLVRALPEAEHPELVLVYQVRRDALDLA